MPASFAERWSVSVVVIARMPCAPAFASTSVLIVLSAAACSPVTPNSAATPSMSRTKRARRPSSRRSSNNALFSGYVSSVGYL